MAATTINTEPLDRMIGQLVSLEHIDFEPLLLELEGILDDDNRAGAGQGLDGFGMQLEPVTYRPNPNKVKPTNYTVLTNNNLTSSWYRELEGPPLAPRDMDSRIVTNFVTSHTQEPGAWVVLGAWADVLSTDDVPFLPFHFRGEGNLPVRDLAHVRPSALRRAQEALHDFALKIMQTIRGR